VRWNLPTGALSPSQVVAYLLCPACYEAKYVLGQRAPVGLGQIVGRAIHSGLERLRRDLVEQGPILLERGEVPKSAVKEYCEEAARKLSADLEHDEITRDGDDDPDKAKDQVVHVLSQTIPSLARVDLARGILAAEVGLVSDEGRARSQTAEFIFPDIVRECWPFPTEAYIDVVYGDGEVPTMIADTKTTKRRAEPDPLTMIQLGWYARPFWWQGHPIQLVIDQVITNSKPDLVSWEVAMDDDDHRAIERTVLKVAAAISAGHFPPRPGWWCNFDHHWPKFFVLGGEKR
jgi:hypothetical protein